MANLKDYEVMPGEGTFEKITRRLSLRRHLRLAGILLIALSVSAIGIYLLAPKSAPQEHQSPVVVATPPTMSAATATEETPSASHPLHSETSTVSPASVSLIPATPVPLQEKPAAEQQSSEPAAVAASEKNIAAESEPILPVPVSETIAETEDVFPAEAITEQEEITSKAMVDPTATPDHENLLWAPNVILPTSDDLQNRQFKLTPSSPVSDFHLYIYSRGGQQVHSSLDINHPWDATLHGQPLPQGTYVWIARFRDTDGNLRQEKGTVTVIR